MPRPNVKSVRQSPKDRILSVAHRLFYSQGINKTGIDQIIAEAEVAKQSFYNHFPSKQSLVMAFLAERHERWLKGFIGAVLTKANNSPGRLLGMFDVLEEWFLDPEFRGCAFLNISVEFSDPGCPERLAAQKHKGELLGFLAELTRGAKLRNANAMAEHLLLLIDGAIVRAQVEQSAEPARQAKAIAISLLKR